MQKGKMCIPAWNKSARVFAYVVGSMILASTTHFIPIFVLYFKCWDKLLLSLKLYKSEVEHWTTATNT